MKDNMKVCQHTLPDGVIYKEVVVIGNGPSGMVMSFMLAGNVPRLKRLPEGLPLDEMLTARLSNLPEGQSLYDVDLMALAEGLEGRSQNPIPLLMDNLLRPCADLGIEADPLIEWKFDIDKQIDHIVLGRTPPGGAWHTFPAGVKTLSPAAWLALPPHAGGAGAGRSGRLSARAVAAYCRRYVHACGLQRYFRCGVVVTRVAPLPRAAAPCDGARCPLRAAYVVDGYEAWSGRPFRYHCGAAVAAAGGGGRPSALRPDVARYAVHSLADVERAASLMRENGSRLPCIVVGSGVSAADAVLGALAAGAAVRHLHRGAADSLARLAPSPYPDYYQVYKMMCDGPGGNHKNYIPYPHHVIMSVAPLATETSPKLADELEEIALRPKRVTLLNIVTNETEEMDVSLIAVLIGSKPDLFFLQTNYNVNYIDVKKCTKCEELQHTNKRKIEDEVQSQCFLKNHWHYLKSMVGQSIQSCKSRYLNYTEINGNNTKCVIPDCNKMKEVKCSCPNKLESGTMKCGKNCDISYKDEDRCICDDNPYSSGIGYGIDPKKAVDGRANPIAVDKSTHEVLSSPKGLYALGPLTADNFIRFIPGGALAIVANIHKENKEAA